MQRRNHPGNTPSTNDWKPGACKDKAQATTNGDFNAAALLRDWDPLRARPTLQRAEVLPATVTTTLLHESLVGPSTRDCTL